MGRCVANAGFLSALLRADPFDGYSFFLSSQPEMAALGEHVEAVAGTAVARKVQVANRLDLPAALSRESFHCFHLSDPLTEQPYLAALRNKLSGTIFPVTGVTHSISYARHAPGFLAHVWPGCTKRDAVVSTSAAGCEVVTRMFASLRSGYGLSESVFHAPQVKQLPLGIDEAAMPAPHAATRARMRLELGVGDEPVLLVVGRISHFSKMDLLPLFRMLRRAEAHGLSHRGYLLVIAGQTSDAGQAGRAGPSAGMADLLLRAAALHGVRLRVIENPDDALRNALYVAADVFLSPSDNVQETFGLTLLEAASAGLPVVASDWDGYRDLVLPNETGILVPTLGPADTSLTDVASRVLYDNQYHLRLAQQTVVDVDAFGAAIARLAGDGGLRMRMGEAGRRMVRERYGWGVVINRWVNLWEELWKAPVDEAACRTARHPLIPPYAEVFGGYPTACLSGEMRLCMTAAGNDAYRMRNAGAAYPGVAALVPPEALHRLLFLARRPVAVAGVMSVLEQAGIRGEGASFLILWALKHDLLELCR